MSLTHPGRECVSQGVAAKVREEYRIIFSLHQHFVIAVPCNSSNRFVHGTLVIGATFPVYEYEVRIAIDGYFALDSHGLLILSFHLESFLHEVQHRNLPDTVAGLRGMNIEIAPTLAAGISVIVVHQSVVDIDGISNSSAAVPVPVWSVLCASLS